MNSFRPIKPSRTAVIAVLLAFVAELARTLASTPNRDLWSWYLGLHLLLLLLFAFVLWRTRLPPVLLHLYFVVQSAIVLVILALNPALDFVTVNLALLSYQAALVFGGWARWTWVGILALIIPGALVFYLESLKGIALGLVPMAVAIVLAAYVAVNEEIEQARATSQTMLDELQTTHRRLQTYAGQVEELAATEERNRLARELHDSVSQTIFSITLNTRTAQILLKQNPERVKPQLEYLQTLTQNALAEMRGLIAELRPSPPK